MLKSPDINVLDELNLHPKQHGKTAV
jgi:hypothetical protein